MLELINDRVIPGALRLTESQGDGWWHRINLERLDSSSDTNSVLGQLYGSREKGLRLMLLDTEEADNFGFHVNAEAFGMDNNMAVTAHRILDLGWVNLISNLQRDTVRIAA
ncbi:hypothetical protein [Actinomadura sp. WMMB 499]|uniref:hypothetical protein n=1 Tax=Actinomadura sp. WMMB 499 TaxID=1219491 RepID=UPI0012454A20|nr:hypothetical protein [Actinomadura sp. WMMB 499]QFG25419.1 hypothetical protein F7P10_33945 [Actinomadura sp. WMMB 499]